MHFPTSIFCGLKFGGMFLKGESVWFFLLCSMQTARSFQHGRRLITRGHGLLLQQIG